MRRCGRPGAAGSRRRRSRTTAGCRRATYDALVRAAELWPHRPAISCPPDAARWDQPATRTFAELPDDVHRWRRCTPGSASSARVSEPAAAPKRVHVVDASPLAAVGTVFKPELRRRAAEDSARDALAGRATDVAARLARGRVVVTVHRGDEAAVRDAPSPSPSNGETV